MIQASFVRVGGTLSDGTLRLIVDVEPRHAVDAFTLFNAPGTPMILSRLTQEAAQASAQSEAIAEHQKGGALAKLAGQWCRTPEFYEFIRPIYDRYMGGDGSGYGDVELMIPDFCRHAILVFCRIDGRAELDHDETAARLFNEKIREPYMAWLKDNG